MQIARLWFDPPCNLHIKHCEGIAPFGPSISLTRCRTMHHQMNGSIHRAWSANDPPKKRETSELNALAALNPKTAFHQAGDLLPDDPRDSFRITHAFARKKH